MLKKLSNTGINLGVLAISVIVFVGAVCALTGLADSGRPPTMTVLVVARDLNMGDVIVPSDLAERTIYEDDNADLYILSDEADRVAGGVAALPMFAGQPVYRTSVLAPAAVPYRMSAILAQYPDHSLVPLSLDATNVIAPDISMFLPGDIVGITVVIAQRPQPPATQAVPGGYIAIMPTVTPVAETPAEGQKTSAEERTAPPLAKDLFSNGVIVIMVQGAPVSTISDTTEDEIGNGSTSPSSSLMTDLGTEPMLLLLVPNDRREELSLAMQQGDQLVISLMARGMADITTPGFTYWDFEALFKADRDAVLSEASPVP